MRRKSGIKVASFFSGAGGLDLGFQSAGYNVVWANDFERCAVETYEKNFGLKPILGDITKVDIDKIPSVDLMIGGPPCQSFSLVGQRKKDDPRGALVFRFLEIIKAKTPQAFLMENVPGMAASFINGDRLTDFLKNEFTKVGYKITVLKLLATDYLVPQKRRRILIIGSRKKYVDKPDPKSYALECHGIDVNTFDLSAKSAIGDLGECSNKGELASYQCKPHSRFSILMRRNNGQQVSLHEYPRMSDTDKKILKHIPPGGNYRDIPDEISTNRIMNFKRSGGRTTTYGRLHPDEPSYTINTYFRRPNVGCNFHYKEPRLITAREAMRFQSFPDYFNLQFNTQDERNMLIGNAVPPLLSEAIAWQIKKMIF